MMRKHIIAYLADWTDWEPDRMDAAKLTHINYAFALIKDGRVSGDHLKKLHLLKELKQKNKDLKLIISIGGWGADGFSDAVFTEESRQLFADTAIDLMLEHELDGIDLDWEYPCRDWANIKARPEDKPNYTLLVKLLRARLDDLTKKTGRPYLLSMAAGAAEIFANDLELDELVPCFDHINLMTYDFSSGPDIVTHHTCLYPMAGQTISASRAVEVFMAAGVPAEKLVLGAAFYGRGWSGLDSSRHPVGQTGKPGVSFRYPACAKAIAEGSQKRCWDDEAKAPYLWDGDTFVGYDDPESLYHKVSFVVSRDLAGIMFWEWSQDEDNELLTAIYETYQGHRFPR